MGKFSAYNLPLKTLTEGTHEFDYRLDKQFFVNMENSDVRDADLAVHLTVTHRNALYSLHFHITGPLTLLCDRCLDDLVIDIDTTYDINVEYGDDYNDESDDLLIIPESDSNLNVSYMLYDTVVLAIPIKHVHPLGKCNRQMRRPAQKAPRRRRGRRTGRIDDGIHRRYGRKPARGHRPPLGRPQRSLRRRFARLTKSLLSHAINQNRNNKTNKQQWHILNANNRRPVRPSVVLTTRLSLPPWHSAPTAAPGTSITPCAANVVTIAANRLSLRTRLSDKARPTRQK